MNKQRIQVYTDSVTKRRIELAATKHEVSVTDYCLFAITQQLADDDLLEAEQVDIPIKQSIATASLIADVHQLRETIKAERGGMLIDLDGALEELRDERDHDLLSMR